MSTSLKGKVAWITGGGSGIGLAGAIEFVKAGAHVYLADSGGTPVFEAKLTRPAILVLGSESHGHSDAASAHLVGATVISIPRLGHAESLNVAMAAAALCTELTRQAGQLGTPEKS